MSIYENYWKNKSESIEDNTENDSLPF
jgi:hypothetical protein